MTTKDVTGLTSEQIAELERVFQIHWVPDLTGVNGAWRYQPHWWCPIEQLASFSAGYTAWTYAAQSAWRFWRSLSPQERAELEGGSWDY